MLTKKQCISKFKAILDKAYPNTDEIDDDVLDVINLHFTKDLNKNDSDDESKSASYQDDHFSAYSHFDYLILSTGYAGKLSKNIDDIRKKTVKAAFDDTDEKECVVYIQDKQFDKKSIKKSVTCYGNKKDLKIIEKILKPEDVWGSICFRVNYSADADEIISFLIDYEHCYGFNDQPSGKTNIHKKYKGRDIKILKLEFDTESG